MLKVSRSLPAWLPALGLGPLLLVAAAQTADRPHSNPDPQKTASLKTVSATAADLPAYQADVDAERQLLDLANQARTRAGAPPLKLDPGLSGAARTHAEAMAAAGHISHQFDGEPTLTSRLASSTALHLEQAGENVALDYEPEAAHDHLMLSPPHRKNLLDPSYDVVGLGVVSSGERLYIVQDFGRALPNLSVSEVKDHVAAAVAEMLQHRGKPVLARHDLAAADSAACSMAQADTLTTPAVQQLAHRYSVLSYTTQHPEQLPASADAALAPRDLRGFSVGACFARTRTYPSGVYWMVVALE